MNNEIDGKKTAIAFLVRDCEKSLPRFLKRIERLRRYFKNSTVYILENNSRDATKRLLEHYRDTNSNVVLCSSDEPELDAVSRMERMTELRNRCIDMVRDSSFEPQYYILIDSDLDFAPPSVIRALKHAPADWAALFANGKYFLKAGFIRIPVLYYDLFAYLPEDTRVGNGDSLTETQMHKLRPHTQRALQKQHYLKCRSAFGGVGIYRYEATADCHYAVEANTVSKKFNQLCEHIPFNRGVAKNGALYVCRDMKVYYEPIDFKIWFRIFVNAHNEHKELQKMLDIYHKLFPHRGGKGGGSK